MSEHNEEMSTKFYLLPCMFTLSSLFCGFYAILAATKGDFVISAIAIIVAAVFDGLDGRVARMTGKTSLFGVELDSLCDNVSFGVAPAILAYFWALEPYGRYGWLAGFLYIATTTLRLARFNVQQTTSVNFVGLPCPAAAAMISSSVLFSNYIGIDGTVKHISLLLLVYLLSYLMVSNHDYCSFKKGRNKGRTFPMVVAIVLLFVLVAAEPQIMFFGSFLLYTASGPITDLIKWVKKKKSTAKTIKESK
ncbi:MAG: CDP-diacylglycerol--serine O-phosphatidyltransferase [Desulfotalea sp.]